MILVKYIQLRFEKRILFVNFAAKVISIMRRSEISKQLHEAVIKAYCEVCDKCWTYQEAFKRIAKMPAPRYFVSEKQARMILSPMMKGDFDFVNLMEPNKRRMYYSLFKEVMKLSESYAYRDKSLSYIVKHAVLQPAPEFFARPNSLYYIRHMIKKNCIDENGRYIREKDDGRRKGHKTKKF